MKATEIVYRVDAPAITAYNEENYRKMMEAIIRHKPESVLEIGSGVGILGKRIRDLGIRYLGLEPDPEQYKIGKERHPDLPVLMESCYADPSQLNLGTFDMVVSNDVIEHCYLPRELVRFAKTHLAPGGRLIVGTPDYGSYLKNLLYSLFNKWDQEHCPLWDGGHVKFFSKATLGQLLKEEGFHDFRWTYSRNVRVPILTVEVICSCSKR